MHFIDAIQISIVVLSIGCLTPNSAMKCYVCMGKEACRSPTLMKCNETLVQLTNDYIRAVHGIEPEAMEYLPKALECFHEAIVYPFGQFYYKGCNYMENNICKYSNKYTDGIRSRACETTNGDDNVQLDPNYDKSQIAHHNRHNEESSEYNYRSHY